MLNMGDLFDGVVVLESYCNEFELFECLFNVGGAEINARGSIINFQMGGHISSAKFAG